MRPLLFVSMVLVGVLMAGGAVPVAGQSLYTDEPGSFIELNRLTWSDPGSSRLALGGAWGYRWRQGVDLGVTFDYEARSGLQTQHLYVGPQFGYHRRLNDGGLALVTRAAARARLGRIGNRDVLPSGWMGYDTDASILLHQRYSLGSRIEVFPGVGVFHRFAHIEPQRYETRFGEPVTARGYDGHHLGVQMTMPISFRVFDGRRFVLEPIWRLGPDTGLQRNKGSFGLGLRFNF